MNHTTRIRINSYEIQTYEVSFNSLAATSLLSFVRKNVFQSKNIQYAYNFCETNQNVCRDILEPSRTSMVELLCENHKKALLEMLDWVLNTSLVLVLLQKRFIEVTIYLIYLKSTSEICHCVLISPINRTYFSLTKKV